MHIRVYPLGQSTSSDKANWNQTANQNYTDKIMTIDNVIRYYSEHGMHGTQ